MTFIILITDVSSQLTSSSALKSLLLTLLITIHYKYHLSHDYKVMNTHDKLFATVAGMTCHLETNYEDTTSK